MRHTILVVFVVTILFTTNITSAQDSNSSSVPNLIRFSGTLKTSGGSTATPAVEGMTFAIYKQQEGGAALWLETQNVTIDSTGRYTVLLGSSSKDGIPTNLFTVSEERWLGVQVVGQPEQARVLMVSVPYAFKAHEADTLGGFPASAYALSPDYSTQSNSDAPTLHGTQLAASISDNKPVGINVLGQGLPNYIPLWWTIGSIQWSVMYQDPNTKNIGVNTKTPVAAFDVNGGINVLSNYQIGGQTAFAVGNLADQNVFAGVGAGISNVAGKGNSNTFIGTKAGYGNTTAYGNTYIGYLAGMDSASDGYNTIVGAEAGHHATAGGSNVFVGDFAGYLNSATGNTFLGGGSGGTNTTGWYNTFLGLQSGSGNTTGQQNIFIGSNAGSRNTSGNNNIYIDYPGAESGTESNTIHIGNAANQSTTYIAGIYGSSPIGAIPVVINPDGQLGTANQQSGVISWNNRTGAVVPQSGDYNFSQVSGTLQSSQLSGTYGQGVSLTNASNGFTGSFSGNGSALTGIQFSQISGTLGSSQLSGTYSNAVTLSNPSNVYYGNGANLTGITPGPGSPYYIQNGNTPQSATFNITGNGTLAGLNVNPGGKINFLSGFSYISGIYGSTTSFGVAVYVDPTGHLGTFTSSRRFKENIRDMAQASSNLFQLRPVTFYYKPEYDGSREPQYGLIAEEVAEVYPELVAYDENGQPYTVKYQYLAPMLLNEMQKQQRVITAQQERIEQLEKRLLDLERQGRQDPSVSAR